MRHYRRRQRETEGKTERGSFLFFVKGERVQRNITPTIPSASPALFYTFRSPHPWLSPATIQCRLNKRLPSRSPRPSWQPSTTFPPISTSHTPRPLQHGQSYSSSGPSPDQSDLTCVFLSQPSALRSSPLTTILNSACVSDVSANFNSTGPYTPHPLHPSAALRLSSLPRRRGTRALRHSPDFSSSIHRHRRLAFCVYSPPLLFAH